MEAKGLFNVARKELIDHLTSRRFIIILALFLIISASGMHEGINRYNQQLESYKELISQIKEVEGIEPGYMPERPSIMLVFLFMSRQIMMLGAILAIAMGFDLVSEEKETRSLKSLLSCPVFRDEIINGKALGGTLALVFAMGAALLISLAVLLIFSIVPSMNELAAILVFGLVSILFLLAYFAIALMISTISGKSGSALIYTLVIFFILGSILPIVGGTVADMVCGDQPKSPPVVVTNMSEEEMQQYNEVLMAWSEKRKPIIEAFTVISPNMNYERILNKICSSSSVTTTYGDEAPGLQDVLGRVWKNILALISFSVVFFALAYVKFMRMDIR